MKAYKFIMLILIILLIIMCCIFSITVIDYFKANKELNTNLENVGTQKTNTKLELNNNIINVDEDSSIRIITKYDKNMFKGHKSLVFFWASWCSHCQEEYEVVKTAISEYQNRGYKIYVISHDYDVDTLAEFMKNNDFNYEVCLDKQRIIRANLNPNASSVPLTYIIDENAKLIASHNGTITLEQLNELINENM